MREGAPTALYAGAMEWRSHLTSFLAGEMLADYIPIVGGTFNEDASQAVPDSLTFTVPRYVDGFDWRPGRATDHPLAPRGQQITASVVATALASRTEYETRLGLFRIEDFQESDGDLTFTCSGAFQAIQEDQPATPLVPRAGGTFASEVRRVVPAGFGIDVDPALADRAAPQSLEYGDDRLAILAALAEAWPARMLVDGFGQVRFAAPLPDVPVPVVEYVNGERGTLIQMPSQGSRDGITNRIIVRATDTDGSGQSPVLAVVDQTSGPFAVERFGVKSKIWSSPFVTNETQARSAGQKLLVEALRPASTVDVEIVPDPRAQIGDAVLARKGGDVMSGYVIGAAHPLTERDGSSKLKVGVA